MIPALWCYRLLWLALCPLVALWFCRRIYHGKEHKTRWSERLGYASAPRPAGDVIWFHGASVGESLSILPLINALLAAQPSLHILVTSGTVSSAKLLEKRLPERAIHQFVPLDTWPCVKLFIRHWQPTMSIFVESELWPELLQQAPKPMLINARLSPRSFAKYQRWQRIFTPVLKKFTRIYAQYEPDAERFRTLGANHVATLPNLKFDSAALPHTADADVLKETLQTRQVLVAASTHPGEEEQVMQMHRQLVVNIPDLLTIIVPRHPERGSSLATELEVAGLTVHQRGAGANITPTGTDRTDIYLADTLGELGLFYHVADVVIIGGTLVPHGGHNPIEPLKQGCITLCGPAMHNFMDMVPILLEQGILHQAKDLAALTQMAQGYLMDANLRQTEQAQINTAMQQLSGSSATLAKHILEQF